MALLPWLNSTMAILTMATYTYHGYAHYGRRAPTRSPRTAPTPYYYHYYYHYYHYYCCYHLPLLLTGYLHRLTYY